MQPDSIALVGICLFPWYRLHCPGLLPLNTLCCYLTQTLALKTPTPSLWYPTPAVTVGKHYEFSNS